MDAVIIAGQSNEPLARAISQRLNLPLTPVLLDHFPSGESRVELLHSIRNRHVYIVQSGYTYEPGSPSPNDHLMQTIMIVDACFRASAKEITLVLPSIAYTEEPDDPDVFDPDSIECTNDLQQWLKDSMFPQRSESQSECQSPFYKQLQEHEESTKSQSALAPPSTNLYAHPNPFKLIASLLQCSGATNLLTFALPRPQLASYFDIPVDNLLPAPLLAPLLPKKYVVAVAELSLAKEAGLMARSLNWPFALVQRLPGDPTLYISGASVVNQDVLLFDDTPHDRSFQAAESLKSTFQASSVSLLLLHLTLSDPLQDLLKLQSSQSSQFHQIFITNSIRIPESLLSCPKVKVIDLSDYLADAIKCLHLSQSLHTLQSDHLTRNKV